MFESHRGYKLNYKCWWRLFIMSGMKLHICSSSVKGCINYDKDGPTVSLCYRSLLKPGSARSASSLANYYENVPKIYVWEGLSTSNVLNNFPPLSSGPLHSRLTSNLKSFHGRIRRSSFDVYSVFVWHRHILQIDCNNTPFTHLINKQC